MTMQLPELLRALRQLGLSGMADTLETRLVHAQAEQLPLPDGVVFPRPPGTGKSHLAQALGRALIQQGHRVLYREAHVLLEDLADATLAGTRRERMAKLAAVPFLILDDLAMRRLPATAAE